MGFREMHAARAKRTSVTSPKSPAKPVSSTFGFAEELSKDIALEKLVGRNFIDDGRLLESDGKDPVDPIRAMLARMDGQALSIRKDLNGLIREGVGMVEAASYLDLGEGSDVLSKLKPVLGRLLTAYTEVVAGLQAARESVGYEVEGPSVTSLGTVEDVSARVTKQFSGHQPGRYLPEEKSGALFTKLMKVQLDLSKRDEDATNVAFALNQIAHILVDVGVGKKPSTVKADLVRNVETIRGAFREIPKELGLEGVMKLVVKAAESESSEELRLHAQRLKMLATELTHDSHVAMTA